jgi:hypothetical protein
LLETLFAILQNSRGYNAVALALASFALYVLAANVAWRIAQGAQATAAKQLQKYSASRGARGLYQMVRLAFYLGVPFVALDLGWIDMRSIGLSLLDWAEGARWAIIILLAAWLLLMIVWLPYLRATLRIPAPPETQQSFARRWVELIYMQAHWMFYRAAVIVLLTGILPDAFYWGAVVGLGLVCVEALLNPRVRAQLTRIGTADNLIWNMGQAFINTLAFFVTRNLPLLILIHFLLELTVPHLRPTRLPPRAGVPPPPNARRPTTMHE